MTWNDSLSVGVDLIDNQHKELFGRIDSFYDTLRRGGDSKEVLDMLVYMQNYVVTHFTAEEGLQRKYSYPKYSDHKKLHDGFVKEVADLKADIEKNGVTVASSSLVGMTLSNLLVNHINIHDKALGNYLMTQV